MTRSFEEDEVQEGATVRQGAAPVVLLHIDDDPLLPHGVRQALAADGYQWLHTSDPEQVMRHLAEQPPALVMMELELAECDGPDLLAGIVAETHGGVPVLVVTRADRSSGLHGEAIALGAADFLTKPVLPAELLERVHELAPPPAAAPTHGVPAAAADPADESGALGDRPVPELLARLHRRGASGVLTLHRGDRRIAVQLRNGTPIGVGTKGRVPPAAGAAEDPAETLLFEPFAWRDGAWSFHRGKKLAPAAARELGAEPAQLLARGVRRATPAEQVRDRLAKHATLYVSVAAVEGDPVAGADLSPEQRARLEEAAGRETLGELLDAGAFEEREIYASWVAGRVDFSAVPTLDLTELYEVAPGIGPEDEEEHQPPPAPAPGPEDAGASADDVLELPPEARVEPSCEAPPPEARVAAPRRTALRLRRSMGRRVPEDAGEDRAAAALDAAPGPEITAAKGADAEAPPSVEAGAEPAGAGDASRAASGEPRTSAGGRSATARPVARVRRAKLRAETPSPSRPSGAGSSDAPEPGASPRDTGPAAAPSARPAPTAAPAWEGSAAPRPAAEARAKGSGKTPAAAAGKAATKAAGKAAGKTADRAARQTAGRKRRRRPAGAAEEPAAPGAAKQPAAGSARSGSEEGAARPAPAAAKRSDIASRGAPGAVRGAAPAEGGTEQPTPSSDARAELARALRDLAQEVLPADDFGALGIEADASDEQVRAACERQLGRIPVGAFEASDLEVRARAERVRDRIQAARDHLEDPDRRRAYALLREEQAEENEVSSSAERALEGERWFRKGKGHLQNRRHEQAVEAFGMASHLDPEEGEYLAHLGYAMYLAAPGEDVVQREAMEHIANGIKRSPGREISYVFLGRLQKVRGDDEAARKLFGKALQLKPDCHSALQEMRLLEMRSRRGKGLLSRLLGS